MDRSEIAAQVLASPAGRRAVVAGDAGTLICLVRKALGWKQSDLGKEAGYSQPTICRLERGEGRISEIEVRARLADILAIPHSAFGLSGSAEEHGQRRTVTDMRRSDFLRGMVGAATSLALPAEISRPDQARIGSATVIGCAKALDRLYELDERHGGATVYALAAEMVAEMRAALGSSTYSSKVGQQLRGIAAATAEHAGWLAFDAGRPEDARRWWLEALHFADRADNLDARVTALSSMALQACVSDNPADGREAIDLMDVAKRSAGAVLTPRLASLINARQAIGYARYGDRVSAIKSMANAERFIGSGTPDEDEPTWLNFWGPADLYCHQARAFLYLGNASEAERSATAAQHACEEAKYPRNYTIYSAVKARALIEAGKVDEAIVAATPVIARVSTLGSRRIITETQATIRLLGKFQHYAPAKAFTSWTDKLLPVS